MTKNQYSDISPGTPIFCGLEVGQVTKIAPDDPDYFYVLWAGKTHSGRYKYTEAIIDEESRISVSEIREIKPVEQTEE